MSQLPAVSSVSALFSFRISAPITGARIAIEPASGSNFGTIFLRKEKRERGERRIEVIKGGKNLRGEHHGRRSLGLKADKLCQRHCPGWRALLGRGDR